MIDPFALGLSVTSIRGGEAYCLCPYHNDHRPSSSFNLSNGKFYCFACGATANAASIARLLGGYVAPYQGELHRRFEKEEKEWQWVLTAESAVGNKYLAKRGVTETWIKRFDIRQFDQGIAFILRDANRTPIGAQLRLYEGDVRYITLGEKPPLWPMPQLLKSNPRRPVIAVEGIFGAIRAREYGIQAFATLGSSSAPSSVRFLSGFPQKGLIFDDDTAGHLAACKILASYSGFFAWCPGAEADEEEAEFWEQFDRVPKGVVYNYREFIRLSGEDKATAQFVERYLRRKSKRAKSS